MNKYSKFIKKLKFRIKKQDSNFDTVAREYKYEEFWELAKIRDNLTVAIKYGKTKS